ncbi:hypothetical protein EI94DRAFT_1147020 [Lactarius quietus]|nr:hypothetical protein EI94DRAFT_1147020 [Lactarius quietus]
MPSEPTTTPKTTTEARVSLTSGPAATTAEARKNKKKRMKESDPTDTAPPQAPKTTLTKVTVSVPEEAVMNETVTPTYPPSEASPTPPPIPMPPLFNEDSPSPLSSPSRTLTASVTPRLPPARLAPLRTPSSALQDKEDEQTTNKLFRPTIPVCSLSEEDITMSNLPERQLGNIASSVRSLAQKTSHDTSRNGRNATRNPLDNYTDAKMPKVHDAHPASPFKYIDLDLISEWELLTGGKLLIIPFGDAAHDPKLHDVIKNRILYAVAEITRSQGIGVSAPSPSDDAVEED